MPKKYIGDLITLIQSTINDPNNKDTERFLAFLDFEKAFDSVNHEFTFAAMEAFGIPYEFIRFTKLAFINTSACCIINGQRTDYFSLPGGGRQGDVLFPSLFCMVVMCITVMIEEDDQIRGINLPGNETFKVMQYADDNVEGFTTLQEYTKIVNLCKTSCKL